MNKPNILIIDDNPKNIQLAAQVLQSTKKYNIFFATSGEKGIEHLNKKEYSLILLDINMPDLDGFETAKIIAGNPQTKIIPIIFLSANANQESINSAFEHGAKDYITKPFQELELINRVDTHVDLFLFQQAQQKTIDESQILLEQYKVVIDADSLVSKTDLAGKITYVNEEFCKVSQYSCDELIGKPHNIIRHPNMPKKAFKNMWDTIQNKQIWRGEVENLAKDGSSYFVKATILPILNAADEIVEYISVRTDITELHQAKEDIINTQREMLFTLGELVEKRSKETGLHVKRVSLYSELLAKEYGLSDKECELIKMASPMHDIGKIAIPDEILLKPGKLTFEEFEIMKTHSRVGYDIFRQSTHEILQTAALISHEHHEKYDGSGYPNALKGDEITIFGRIVGIVDVFDALSHARVYKEAWGIDEVISYIISEKSKSFDPELVDILIDNIDTFLKIKNTYM